MEPFVEPGHELWAHPVAVLAIPAFIPVVVVIVTVLWVARRDRIAEARERAEGVEGVEGADAVEGRHMVDAIAVDAPVDQEPAAGEAEPGARRRWRDRIPSVVIVDEHGEDRELRPRDPGSQGPGDI